MKLTIGENIRNLRREKDITQEEFANTFGVSYQSVSRWENGTCYPDVELIPDIADYFGISVDKLMGADKSAEQRDVERYLARYSEAANRGLIYDCIDIAREGVSAYPNNYTLLYKLMWALFVSTDDDGNIAEWYENRLKYDGEITALGERIMKYCPDQDIRLEAISTLAFNHCELGRRNVGRKLFESLPSGENCRENSIWWALEDFEREPYLRERIKYNFEKLYSFTWLLAESDFVSDEDSVCLFNKLYELQRLVTDGNAIENGWGHARVNLQAARRYMRLGDISKGMERLSRCIDAAIAFDNRPDEQCYGSTMLGTVTEKRLDFETSDTRTLCRIVLEDWITSADFDCVRDTAEFIAEVSRL